jgi:hypothetical protein
MANMSWIWQRRKKYVQMVKVLHIMHPHCGVTKIYLTKHCRIDRLEKEQFTICQ